MPEYGYFLSCEEFGPAELVEQARMAEQAGFQALWISDHYHPWNDAQGQSPFVWSVIGALSEAVSLPIETAVTCPTVRMHPAVVAQAAATSAVMTQGRFRLGVGSGEALNEHILGDAWPPATVRLEMLEEAIQVMRRLFTGEEVTHYGKHYTVENARLYTVPEEPVPIDVSGFGPKATSLAARVGDGYITMMPDASMVEQYRKGGGGSKPVSGGMKVCYGTDRDEAVRTVHKLWPNQFLPGEMGQILPTPSHFEQLEPLVTEEMVADGTVCGDDVDQHVAALTEFADAGFDRIYVNQIGPDQQGFFDFYRTKVLPRLP
ncbi:LLM class F420-dependent oxidoreductase [Streptomyces longwoodensis]|uniref:LLM class F420-dependent oxidoreductase n=1 Tax=Streptomyces lasalocidi TaxID=324833 RepID=A0A4U5WPC2_STRLS|nr:MULTISPECIES: LLM class F420-dependent oxidoreductase [Streptomyces]MCX4996881.1 LLM class F420-dependent oxidoreductase [Streptomyces longwoodensis]TKT03800.1 LLM class F420-dependent oxidoreductase [Streptomyces lasalocidi]WRY91543.1 LLM class F420-dependent oxidoreductase [Streptomyces longwoodensis]WTI44165.1 LLM class F420-dependent oxidoreductase [Streptomyces longwoodensis]WUC56955.1 LLM class F420-dependent oxidoreductase [Streptomyces longwoodensis]